MAEAPLDFFKFTRSTLGDYLVESWGLPRFTATQLFDWVYRKQVLDFSLMTNISKRARTILQDHFTFAQAKIQTRQISADGTRKYVFEVAPGVEVESVMIKQAERMTLCVSSQVGCGMGCSFCQTATMGFQKNLSAGDIIRQVLAVREDAKQFSDDFSNIVFMGMGEPLHNFSGVTSAINILLDDMGLAIGPRRITVSTVGLVPAIKKFMSLELGVNLAVSLNATSDTVRSNIMPINTRYPLANLLGTLREVPLARRKKITIEYVMLAGVNDTASDLERLPQLLDGIQSKVNLIPYNENAGLGFKSPSNNTVHRWAKTLNDRGVSCTIRWSKGKDIDAACGQLKVKTSEKLDRIAV